MPACTEFTCSHCAFKIEAWDDGNRYLTDSEGKRHFFYHPGDITEMRIFAEECERQASGSSRAHVLI